MKNILLPLAILLFAACNKSDLPAPANADASAISEPATYSPAAAMRLSGDTLTKITRHFSEAKPLTNQKEPVISR